MHSNLVFSPSWDTNWDLPSKTPSFRTLIQKPVSGRGEIRASLQPYPIWTIEYSLEHARGTERDVDSVYAYILGFYMAMGGQASDFLYMDPNDNTVEAEVLGIGDGHNTTFQLTRSIGIGTDIVQNPGQAPPVMVSANGVELGQMSADNLTFIPAGWSVGYNGIVQFTSPPAIGTVLTWSGSFFYRVRFEDDSLSMDQDFSALWSSKSIKFTSVIL